MGSVYLAVDDAYNYAVEIYSYVHDVMLNSYKLWSKLVGDEQNIEHNR